MEQNRLATNTNYDLYLPWLQKLNLKDLYLLVGDCVSLKMGIRKACTFGVEPLSDQGTKNKQKGKTIELYEKGREKQNLSFSKVLDEDISSRGMIDRTYFIQ